MVLSEDKDLILVKPPALLTEKKYLRKDVYYLPKKAIYGLGRSPKLWGLTRDETITAFDIQVNYEGKSRSSTWNRFNQKPICGNFVLEKMNGCTDC